MAVMERNLEKCNKKNPQSEIHINFCNDFRINERHLNSALFSLLLCLFAEGESWHSEGFQQSHREDGGRGDKTPSQRFICSLHCTDDQDQ